MTAFDRALLPELIKFSYIPQNELRIHSEPQAPRANGSRREPSPDFSVFSAASSSKLNTSVDAGEHVLVLEFADNSRGTKSQQAG